jgi:hypothetical protein
MKERKQSFLRRKISHMPRRGDVECEGVVALKVGRETSGTGRSV